MARRKIFILVVMIFISTGAVTAYNSYFSQNAKVSRLVKTYYAAQLKGDTKKMATMETPALQKVAYGVLGASTDNDSNKSKKEDRSLELVATKLNKDTGAVTGLIKSSEKSETDSGNTPFLIQVVKIEGNWKIGVFNIGLISNEDMK